MKKELRIPEVVQEIELVNQYGEILVSSREVAKNFGKRHSDTIKAIETIIKKENWTKNYFIESVYTDKSNRQSKQYLITKDGLDIIENKFRFNIRCSRFEYKFFNLIKELFPNENIITQMPVLNYRVDFYLPFANILIEYDETHHKFQMEEDGKRIKEIRDEIMRKFVSGEPLFEGDSDEANPWLEGKDILTVIRVKQGKEIEGIRKIMLAIHENGNSPAEFMK